MSQHNPMFMGVEIFKAPTPEQVFKLVGFAMALERAAVEDIPKVTGSRTKPLITQIDTPDPEPLTQWPYKLPDGRPAIVFLAAATPANEKNKASYLTLSTTA